MFDFGTLYIRVLTLLIILIFRKMSRRIKQKIDAGLGFAYS